MTYVRSTRTGPAQITTVCYPKQLAPDCRGENERIKKEGNKSTACLVGLLDLHDRCLVDPTTMHDILENGE